MSKADQLGSSSAFGRASTPRSSRRDTIDNAIRGGGEQEATITDLPVTLISDNPDNPRNHLRALEETVESVREVGIVLPIVVATVEAYLHERPHRAEDLDDGAQYIVVDGHRRLEAARRVGFATIPVRIDNARVSSDEALLEAAFVANYHRDDMTDLEEAQALKSLVDHYGSQIKASKRLGIPQNTISSKLSLLKLSPELQKDLVTGTRTVEHVRNLGKLSPEAQKAKADERAAVEQQKAARKTLFPPRNVPNELAASRPAPAPKPAESTVAPGGAKGEEFSAENSSNTPVPEPRAEDTHEQDHDDEAPAWLMPEGAIRHFSDLFIERAQASGRPPEEVMWETFTQLMKDSAAAA
ncbi:ParB/RepB/Spo0J family partition protein [Streptomyces sioyaensis]|uniref:ParB/RepB/Spo0J family partition protein n=1 Tax=Streptomyces sioyaensis TaxID=67364 RepID=UPI0036E6C4C0